MSTSHEQAQTLADALHATADRLGDGGSLDDLLRLLDLGDRLCRMDADAIDAAGVHESVDAARAARPHVVARMHELTVDERDWEPLDAIGDQLMQGELAGELVQWGMAVLRLANALDVLEGGAQASASWVLRRALDRLDLAPDQFLPLVQLAAGRIEHEDTARQPPEVQRMLEHMVLLGASIIEEEELDLAPPRLELVRSVARLLNPGSTVDVSTQTGTGMGRLIRLEASQPALPTRLAADDGRQAEPPPDHWVVVWSDAVLSVSLAERAAGPDSSAVTLSVVLGPGAPSDASLAQSGAIVLVDAAGRPVPLTEQRRHEDEWRATFAGDVDVTLQVPALGVEVELYFARAPLQP